MSNLFKGIYFGATEQTLLKIVFLQIEFPSKAKIRNKIPKS